MITCRRKARESALQALYQCDALCDWSKEMIDLYFSEFHEDAKDDSGTRENWDFSRVLIDGVVKNFDEIDAKISTASQHWSLARMSRVDRNILRCAVFEMMYCEDIPLSVSINEAIEVAKRFSSDDSPMFINGVLDKIAHEVRPEAALKAAEKRASKKVVNF